MAREMGREPKVETQMREDCREEAIRINIVLVTTNPMC